MPGPRRISPACPKPQRSAATPRPGTTLDTRRSPRRMYFRLRRASQIPHRQTDHLRHRQQAHSRSDPWMRRCLDSGRQTRRYQRSKGTLSSPRKLLTSRCRPRLQVARSRESPGCPHQDRRSPPATDRPAPVPAQRPTRVSGRSVSRESRDRLSYVPTLGPSVARAALYPLSVPFAVIASRL